LPRAKSKLWPQPLLHVTEGLDDFILERVPGVVDPHPSIHGNMSDRVPRHAEDDVGKQFVGQAARYGSIGKVDREKVCRCSWSQ